MHSMPSKGVPPELPRRPAPAPQTQGAASVAPVTPHQRPACTAFDAEDYCPMGTRPTAARVIDALLKKPGVITYEIVAGRRTTVSMLLLAALMVCLLSYGLVMGFFSGAQQLWIVPAKTTLGFLLSGLLCLPSLYILSSLAGARQSLGEMASLLLAAMALCAMLLLGFAPITWVFSQSTEATQFMGGLHILFLGVSLWFSLQLLRATLEFLNKRALPTVATWCVIFAVVLLQMCATLRPLVGPFEGYELGEKKLFLVHWLDCLTDE